MSRIGKLPVIIPESVTVEIKDREIKVKGPKGELSSVVPGRIEFKMDNNEIIFTCPSESQKNFYGLARTLTNNMVIGVTEGFSKKLEIQGVGYKAKLNGKKLILSLGYSHPIEFIVPDNLEMEVDEKENTIVVSGIDKQAVGEAAAKIRSYRKPEPYKGKGIRYEGEYVPRKEGKKVAAAE